MRVRLPLLPPIIIKKQTIMEKYLVKENIGEFFSKMYEQNLGKNIEVSLRLEKNEVQVYYRDRVTKSFEHLEIVDSEPTLDELIKTLSEDE